MSPPAQDDPRSDQALIAAANAGDVRAFEALYFRYRDYALRLATRYAGDYDTAIDAVQESFTYFYNKFPGFTLTAKMTTFLFPVVKHNALSAKKKARRAQGDHDPDILHSVADHHAPPAPAEDDGQSDIHALLVNLPQGQREVLLLRFVDGLQLDEIATALDIPLGTVKTRVHHALKKLRDDPKLKKYFLD